MVDAAIVMIENAHKHLERARARAIPRENPDRGGIASRPGAVLQPVDHHRLVHADLHAGGAGGPAVQPARLHQDVCDGGGGGPVGDAGAGADGGVRARQDHSGAQKPDQPFPDLDLSAGHQGGDARQNPRDPDCGRHSCRDGVAGPATRHRVHAQSERGHAALHADHAARTFRHQGRRIAADAGPDHPELSRSGIGLRQGRPRGDRDRSGADRDVRDHHQPETEGRMAGRADARGPHGRNGQGAAVSRRLQCLDPADQGAHRHALDGDPHADRRQGDRHRSGRDRPARKTGRAGAADGAGDVIGLCRARHRRLLSRHRARPRGARALRHHDPGRAGRHCDRARRADRDDHGRGPPALFRQHALSPRPAQRPADDRARRSGADAGRRGGAAGGSRKSRAGARADLDPDRERPARGLRLCRYQGPRHRRLRRRCQAGRERQHPVSARRLSDVERPV